MLGHTVHFTLRNRVFHILKCLPTTFLHRLEFQLTLFVPIVRENPFLFPPYAHKTHRFMPHLKTGLGLHATPPRPTRTPPSEEGGAARTCDGHIADALLVHGRHQDHGLRLHHHGSGQCLEDTKTVTGSERNTPHESAARALSPKASWERLSNTLKHPSPSNTPPTPTLKPCSAGRSELLH